MTAFHSTRPPKPSKPSPDFPLYAHATGRWAKKICGRTVFFGKWEDPDGALASYLEQKDTLHAGLTPSDASDALTVFQPCGKFLTWKKQLVENHELSPHTFKDYVTICQRLVKAFGKTRLVRDLRPDDFQRLRVLMAKSWGPVRLRKAIICTRVVFNYAEESGLSEKRTLYGKAFGVPSQATLRKAKAATGPRMFEAHEIHAMLSAAKQPLRAMILLGINCGFGNSDVGTLPSSALNLEEGWVSYARPKSGIGRRCPLWEETIDALEEWLAVRPEPRSLHAKGSEGDYQRFAVALRRGNRRRGTARAVGGVPSSLRAMEGGTDLDPRDGEPATDGDAGRGERGWDGCRTPTTFEK